MAPSPLPPSFILKKSRIIASLTLPAPEYDDLSPKGSIDEGIRDLIEGINAREGWVTTSSCAGRVSVFVEGRRAVDVKDRDVMEGEGSLEIEGERGEIDKERELWGEARVAKAAGAGGKGGGGKWLFVSHEVVSTVTENDAVEVLGMHRIEEVHQEAKTDEGGRSITEERLIHFKFEPMILHILTASLAHAQSILGSALQAGFRESGALNLVSSTSQGPTPMVAVRSTGLALDSIVGRLDADEKAICITSESYLRGLLALANERFAENSKRIDRFRDLLLSGREAQAGITSAIKSKGGQWEERAARRERMRAEGLKKREELVRESNDCEDPYAASI